MPPFLIPVATFVVWVLILFFYWPAIKSDLHLADQLIAPQFFISQLILAFSWVFSGPILAAILSILSVCLVFYLALSSREPAFLLQALIYSGFFLVMVSYLHYLQKKANDQQILKEKLAEEIHLKKEESLHSETVAQALEEKIYRFLNLHSFSEELKSMSDPHSIAQKIVQEAFSVLGKADECVLYLVNEEKEGLSLIAGIGAQEKDFKSEQSTVFDEWAVKRNQAIVIDDSKKDFRFSNDQRVPHDRLRSVCVSPLFTENKVLGVVRASSKEPNIFTTEDLRLLDIFASLGAVVLRNILLYQKMGELAIRDGLTGLYLNRYFQERLNEEIQRAALSKTTFSIVLIDIDFFKKYNDEHGHAAGDLVLKSIAGILEKNVGPQDTAARYGGEEFVLLLPGQPMNKAFDFAEKIRKQIEKSKLVLRRMEGKVTASMGVASFPEGGRTKEEMIWTADRRLYEAKKTGRNRVCGNI